MPPSLLNTFMLYLKTGYSWLFKFKTDAWRAAKGIVYSEDEPSLKPLEAATRLLEITRVISCKLVSEKLKFAILLDNGDAILDVRDSRVSRWGIERIPLSEGPSKSKDQLYYAIECLEHYHSFLNLEPLQKSQETSIASLDITKLGPVTGVAHPSLRHPDGPSLITDGVANIIADPKIPYGFRITNKTDSDLYAYLYFLDNHDFSIAPYYISPNVPLRAHQSLTIGYGTNPGPPAYAYFLREGVNLEVGFLKLLLSKKPLDGMSQIEQHVSFGQSQKAPDRTCVERMAPFIYDAVTVTVVQRRG